MFCERLRIERNYWLTFVVFLLSACGMGDQPTILEVKQLEPNVPMEVSRNKSMKTEANILLLSSSVLTSELNRVSVDIISVSLPRDRLWEIKLLSDPEVVIQSNVEFQIPIADSTAQNKYDIEFRWLPKKVGRYYLRVHASHSTAEATEVREFALILNVSSNNIASSQAALLKKQNTEPNAAASHSVVSGVIELLADETIHSKK